jgi:hypothetical protein
MFDFVDPLKKKKRRNQTRKGEQRFNEKRLNNAIRSNNIDDLMNWQSF